MFAKAFLSCFAAIEFTCWMSSAHSGIFLFPIYVLLCFGAFLGLFNNYFEVKLKFSKLVEQLLLLSDDCVFENRPPNNGLFITSSSTKYGSSSKLSFPSSLEKSLKPY